VLVVSDVIGDDLGSIASGPCSPDPLTAADVRRALDDDCLLSRIPTAMRTYLERVASGEEEETPKPGNPAFDRVTARLVTSNRSALDAAASRGRELGLDEVRIEPIPLCGEAAEQGRLISDALVAQAREFQHGAAHARICLIWGGETTVTLGRSRAAGGRCQELALAAAERLGEAGVRGIHLLAAGTDGRDGPTDAAGAIVDASSWSAIRGAGRDPARDLREHSSYDALGAIGALLRPGLTDTNVGDVVVGMVDAHRML
jgi:glycerate-2-kinase